MSVRTGILPAQESHFLCGTLYPVEVSHPDVERSWIRPYTMPEVTNLLVQTLGTRRLNNTFESPEDPLRVLIEAFQVDCQVGMDIDWTVKPSTENRVLIHSRLCHTPPLHESCISWAVLCFASSNLVSPSLFRHSSPLLHART